MTPPLHSHQPKALFTAPFIPLRHTLVLRVYALNGPPFSRPCSFIQVNMHKRSRLLRTGALWPLLARIAFLYGISLPGWSFSTSRLPKITIRSHSQETARLSSR